jgi:hypothetical protein
MEKSDYNNPMVEQKMYKTGALPTDIKWQVLSFLRVQWPEGFEGRNRVTVQV